MIPEQRLCEIAAADPVAVNYDTVREIAAELLAARAELATVRAERDRYHDALVARHGGEPVALLSELDAARADAESARREGQEIAAGLHEKLHELRAENERLAAEVVAATAEKWKVKNRAREACLAIVARLGSVGAESVDDAVARLLAENERLAKQRDELARWIVLRGQPHRDGACSHCYPKHVAPGFVCAFHVAEAIAAEQPKPALHFNGVPVYQENSFLDGKRSPQEIWPAFPEQPKPAESRPVGWFRFHGVEFHPVDGTNEERERAVTVLVNALGVELQPKPAGGGA